MSQQQNPSSRGSAGTSPLPIAASATSASSSAAITIPGSAPHRAEGPWHVGTPQLYGSSLRAFDAGDGGMPRGSLMLGAGSFVAGHSVFRRTHAAGTSSRTSLDMATPTGPAAFARQASGGGPYLGLEPGLGLTSPLVDHHQHGDRAAAGSAAGTPRAVPAAAPEAAAAAGVVQFEDALSAGAGPTAAAAGEAISKADAAAAAALQNDIIYGIINSVVGIPTMISFAAIVYQDELYKPLLGQLARISFFSAALHQLMFTIFSSLPFAVGQPQDVGLIFLSSMATSIADIGREEGLADSVVVGTALLNMAVATLLVGLLTWVVAHFKLATLVQYVPLPVVGGYLGFVGYFCLAAGIGLGTSTSIDSFSSWGQLASHDALIKFGPTIVAALALWATMTRARSPWALPVTLAAVPAAFYAYLLATGTSLADAQDAGWVLKPEGKSTQQAWELYELFNISDWRLDGVCLPAIARQMPKMLGLFFVVVFGSSLDVAAIQADMPFPIDYNRELRTVALSNVVVGLSGSGFTGSYIFSQTIFSMRAGVSGWYHGAIIAGLEGAIFLLPFSVVQYLPNFFFGALLTVFGIEIAGDWLVRSAAKVSPVEYYLLLATFVAIMQLGLEYGVAAGILMCTIYFAFRYAQANMAAVRVLPTRSAAVRSYTESHLLEDLSGRLSTVALSGFMFFGSSVLMSDSVIGLARDMTAPMHQDSDNFSSSNGPAKQPDEDAGDGSLDAGPSGLRLASLAFVGQPLDVGSRAKLALNRERLALLRKQAPAFIILDFRRVLGVDATSAQTMASLNMVLRRMGVELILTRVTQHSIRRLLAAHGIIAPSAVASSTPAAATSGDVEEQQQPLLTQAREEQQQQEEEEGGFCRVFDTLNEGAKHAEDRLLAMAQASGLLQDGLTGLSLLQFFSMHCSQGLLTSGGVNVQQIADEVAKLGAERSVAAGQRLFSFDERPDSFFLILKGVVSITVKPLGTYDRHASRALPAQLDVMEVERSFSSGQGAVVGVTDFVLRRLRSFQADSVTPCTVMEISRATLDVMVAEVPAVATALQAVLLRDACLSEIYAYDVLERAALS